jgi:hypothetical protein
MTLRDNLDDLDKNGKIGDWCFLDGHQRIGIRYGEDSFAGKVVIPISKKGQDPFHWGWNGDENKPTIYPSILIHPYPGWNKGWHGWLRDGELVEA